MVSAIESAPDRSASALTRVFRRNLKYAEATTMDMDHAGEPFAAMRYGVGSVTLMQE